MAAGPPPAGRPALQAAVRRRTRAAGAA